MISFMFGNHSHPSAIQDQTEYLVNGLLSSGLVVQVSDNTWAPNGVNIMLENFSLEFSYVLSKVKKENPNSRFAVVVTEVFKEGFFRSANVDLRNSSDQGVNSIDHYADRTYWEVRTEGFLSALPFIDAIICNSEILVNDYKIFNKPLFYLPLASTENFPRIEQASLKDRYIDFLFSGHITPYRASILQILKAAGYNVATTSPTTSDFYRRFFHMHSKLVIGPKLYQSTEILSKSRAHYMLANRLPHLFEKTLDHTDLHKHVRFSSGKNNFALDCIMAIEARRDFSDAEFLAFINDPVLNYDEIFAQLSKFLQQL